MANPFESARIHVWNGLDMIGDSEKFLCHAIQRAADSHAITQQDADLAVAMIRTRLGEYPTVEGWLYNEAGLNFTQMNDRSVQRYRVLWLAELSVKWNQGERT